MSPAALSATEPTVLMQVKLPLSLHRGLKRLAVELGDGDVSSFVRMMIRAKLREHPESKRRTR